MFGSVDTDWGIIILGIVDSTILDFAELVPTPISKSILTLSVKPCSNFK